ncbi:RING-H2 finger protein ATL39-like [Miscanthus floridulus]|uniref:RING-H2 finger protein ATL39-like n=1 Tax=Miscanthus floridulus TaxID=154761 RepID=UPI003459F1AE
MDDAVRTAGAGPSTARWGRRSTLLLTWSLAELVTILVYAFAGRLWGFVVAGVLLALVFIFTCYYLRRSRGSEESTVGQQPAEPRPHQLQANGGVGLSQGDIKAIPAFEYRAADGGGSGPSSSSSAEECAVCISVLRDGETVRRLPACGHAFHARCINGWLRGHATCPICRAGIMVVASDDGEPSPVAAAV